MILKKQDQKLKSDEHMRGGKGTVRTEVLPTPEEAGGKGRLYGRTILEPGCSIGYHEHHGECESYYILSGEALFSDNGQQVKLTAGDYALCPDGQGHSIENVGTDTLEFIALILSTKAE